MLTINTNLSSLIAQSSMKSSTNKLNQAIERMTTGFKINHAKDNAANYSIATNMTTKIGAYNVAEDNAAMGLDLISTAEGTLSQIEDKLQRLRALAEQASNGTYGEQSLNAINAEANALVDEIERIYNNTEYNGQNLFKGEAIETATDGFLREIVRRDTTNMTKLSEVDETQVLRRGVYSISTPEELAKLATITNAGLLENGCEFVLANNICLSGYQSGEGWVPIGTEVTPFNGIFDGNGYTISDIKIDRSSGYQGLFGWSLNAYITNICIKNANINATSGYNGILSGEFRSSFADNIAIEGAITASGLGAFAGRFTESQVSNIIIDCDIVCNMNYSVAGGFAGCFAGLNNAIDNVYITASISKNVTNANLGGLMGFSYAEAELSNCNIYVAENNVPLIASVRENRKVTLNNVDYLSDCSSSAAVFCSNIIDGSFLEINNCSYNKNTAPSVQLINATSNYSINNVTTNDGTMNLTKYSVSDVKEQILQVGINSNSNSQLDVSLMFSLGNINVLRNIGTTKYYDLDSIDRILAYLNDKLLEFGATSNRLESVLEEITIQRDNLVSSRSTIRDADIAEVSSHYIQQQILQQASATLLATANQSPSIALQLI